MNNLPDRQIELAREFQIALVMRGDCLNRAGAVTEQNVIGYPDRNFLVVRRIDRERAGEDAGFFFRELGALEIAFSRGAFAIFADCRPLLFGHDLLDQRMFGREHHVSRAVKCVWPRRKYADFFIVIVDLEIDFGAFAPADPVSLK